MTLLSGDCIERMRELPEGSVAAVVTDPPYGLGFMGQDWDSPGGLGDHPMRRNHGTNTVNTGVTRQGGRQRTCEDFTKRQLRDARSYQDWCEEWARECLRVLQPGGFILAFGGTRTYHRLTTGIEEAGFEIRDTMAWLYGQGYPKHKSLLKPALELLAVGRMVADPPRDRRLGLPLERLHEPRPDARRPGLLAHDLEGVEQVSEPLSTRHLSVRQLLDRGDLVAAARREAEAADRDGYDVTAELLRQLADAVEGKSHA